MDGRIAANKARTRPLAVRFEEKVLKDPDGCWRWTGRRDQQGYGHILADGSVMLAHRVSYELHCGAILPGAVIHHLCGVPACVNPTHLAMVTRAEHGVIERRTFVCKHGHPRRRSPRGRWVCPTCQIDSTRRYMERRKSGEA